MASIIALAAASAVPGLAGGFTYDDRSIILLDSRVHSLVQCWRMFAQTYWPPQMGPALYRPIASVGFALEWALGRGNPWVFHAWSVALYASVCVAVYALASELLPRGPAWVAAALFAVHPVHVEAVAPAVGQSELWVALAGVSAAALYVRWRAEDRERLRASQIALLASLYAVACLSKENGIVVLALILAAELTVVRDSRPFAERMRALRLCYLVLMMVAVLNIAVRQLVIGAFAGDYPNRALAHLTVAGRLWTMLGVVPDWVRLLVWPARLVEEYAPPETAIYTTFTWALLPALVTAAGVIGLAVLASRHSRVGRFAFAWLAIALLPVSNVLMPTGVILAERTLFLPSVGIVLLAGALACWVSDRVVTRGQAIAKVRAPRPAFVVAGVGALLLAGVMRSAAREHDWRDDITLFAAGVSSAPTNAATHYLYGRSLFGAERWSDGEHEMRVALTLDPTDALAAIDLATAYEQHGMCGPAEPLYAAAVRRLPRAPAPRAGLARCLLHGKDYANARAQARIGLFSGYDRPMFRALVTAADSGLAAGRRPPT